MVWNPLLKRWNCIGCYISYFGTKTQKKKLQDILKQKKEEEKGFDKWLSKYI